MLRCCCKPLRDSRRHGQVDKIWHARVVRGDWRVDNFWHARMEHTHSLSATGGRATDS